MILLEVRIFSNSTLIFAVILTAQIFFIAVMLYISALDVYFQIRTQKKAK